VFGVTVLYDNQHLSVDALHASNSELAEAIRRAFPRRPTRDFLAGRTDRAQTVALFNHE